MPPKNPSQRVPLTHFLCLPLVTPASRTQLRTSLQHFATDVISLPPSQGPSDSSPRKSGVPAEREKDGDISLDRAIRPLGTIHLTLGVMRLPEPERVEGAIELLLKGLDLVGMLRTAEEASSQAGTAELGVEMASAPATHEVEAGEGVDETGLNVAPASTLEPLTVSVTSLTSMHPPAKTSILYSRPTDTTGRLLPFCQQIRDVFVHAGFIAAEDRPLLLHATLLNTIYAGGRGSRRGNRRDRRGKPTLDARDLIERYSVFEFAAGVKLEKLAICKMGAKKLVDEQGRLTGEEEYEVVAERDLPGSPG